MNITDEILEQAMTLFDSAGVVAEGDGAVLILGLEHTPDRNLDEGVVERGKFRNKGFPKHVKPRMLNLIDVINDQ